MQNNLANFNKKILDFIVQSAYSWFNIAEGAKRSGKDVDCAKAFCRALEVHENKLHLVGGVSVATAKLNVIDCNGYGILNHFHGRCRQGKFQERDAVYIQTLTGEKIVLISGGGKQGDEKLIKGNTYGMALITEANECHPLFIKEVFDRTISSADRKIWHTLNPKTQKHWYYEEVLNQHFEKQKSDSNYGFNYCHTTIADNYSLSDEQIRAALRTYDQTSVWFKRDIIGERCAAEGGMFLQFAANPQRWLIDTPAKQYRRLFVGVDFGGSKAKTVFILIGEYYNPANGKLEIHILDEHIVKSSGAGIDSNQIAREHKAFFLGCSQKYGIMPEKSFTDHNFISFTTQLGRDLGDTSLVRLASKRINLCEWARYINTLFNADRLKILKDCKESQKMFMGMLFDPKAQDDRPLDDGTCENDIYDATRYAMSKLLENWIVNKVING